MQLETFLLRYVATEYVYDADGRKVEEWYYYGPNKESPVHDVWEYDQYGNQTKWTRTDSYGETWEYVEIFIYSEDGEITGCTSQSFHNGELEQSNSW